MGTACSYFSRAVSLSDRQQGQFMIDLHCHVLPGVDDGARTMDDALALSRLMVGSGIRAAVLTPHVYPGVFDNRWSSLAPVFSAFRRALRGAGIPLQVYLGGEVHLHPDAFGLLKQDELPAIGMWEGQPLVLIEFPDGAIPPGAETACRMFADQGIRWLIAHPERNKAVMRDPMRIRPFVDAGCLLQLTAASVIGAFGPAAAKTAHLLLARGMTHVVATDTHNVSSRPPRLREARDYLYQRFGLGVALRLTEETPLRILSARSDFQPIAGPAAPAGR